MLKKCLKIWPRSQQVEQLLPGVALEPMDSSQSVQVIQIVEIKRLFSRAEILGLNVPSQTW